MTRPSLRWVLLWPILATLTLGALALGVYVERSVGRDLIATINEELNRALTAGAAPNGGPARPQPGRPGTDGAVDTDTEVDSDQRQVPIQLLLTPNGEVIEESPAGSADFLSVDLLASLSTTEVVRTMDGDPRYQVRTAMARNGNTALVALSLEQVDDSMASLRRNLIVGGLGLVVVQAAVVWLIAGAVARPVTRMSDVAHRIATGELETDVGPAEGPRETAALATDLSQMLTRLRATIEVQEAAAADATRAKDDMERFIADASHELRTPLTALKGYSDLYQNGMLDDDGVKRAMSRIGSESERLTRLVVDLLKLVRTSEVEESVDLAAITSAVCHDVRAAHPDRDIEINIVDDQLAPPTVSGDPHHLHQAVLNLAANACHHTPASTPVELGVMTDEQSVFVSVIDHGPGVDPATASQLFLPFTRGDESRSRASHDGAGLGLALVHQIAERHQGSVVVTETPGGGATFTIRLPRSVAVTLQ